MTDELGWRRYHAAKFATSRVVGALAEKPEKSARIEALLNEALNEFPEEAQLHKLRFENFPPIPAERDRQYMEWMFAEYAGLTATLPGLPTSTTLASLVHTLRKRHEERLRP